MEQQRNVAEMIDEALKLAIGEVEEMAREVGVSRTTLHLWRRGERSPSPDNLRRLADVLERRAGGLRDIAERLREEAEGG